MRSALLLLIATTFAASAAAQDLPPREILDKIIPQLQKPLPSARIVFRPVTATSAPACNMQNFEMTLESGTKKPNQYPVLLDVNDGAEVPRVILARIPRLAVDADGAERAYHPEDVFGKGVCTRSQDAEGRHVWRGICALDSFSSSGIRIFDGTERVKFPSPSKQPEESEKAVSRWKHFWALIRERKLPSIDLKAIGGTDAPDGYRMFYWKAENLTAFFKAAIVPQTSDGYPCLHGAEARHPGYFIAATTLTQASSVRADGCTINRYIDALEIPFFVLPGGSVGRAEIGDIVIGIYKSGNTERLAFGIAADAGPVEQFGEASVAFSQILLGQVGRPVMNIDDVNALDIDSERLKKENATISILVLGGTKERLNGNYSRQNIENVGRAALARWNSGGNTTARLNACIRQLTP